jgi:hypothetical protein
MHLIAPAPSSRWLDPPIPSHPPFGGYHRLPLPKCNEKGWLFAAKRFFPWTSCLASLSHSLVCFCLLLVIFLRHSFAIVNKVLLRSFMSLSFV